MLKFDVFTDILEKIAPICLSQKMIELGHYDNSGVIVKNTQQIEKVLFALDLTAVAVSKAKELGCDTIITHHPAIYAPLKNLSIDNETAPLLDAIKSGMNVISMHLNLDVADYGIDQELAKVFAEDEPKILELIDGEHGYGREFTVNKTLNDLVGIAKERLGTDKIICYGEGKCVKMATFCGSGGGSALDAVLSGNTGADTILTSDVQHHQLKELIEKMVKVIIIPHYVAEDYGFNKFYERVKSSIEREVELFYFRDERFV